MRMEIEFNMDNAAFEEAPEEEVNRILNVIGSKVMNGFVGGAIHDVNGNNIGNWDIWLEEEE